MPGKARKKTDDILDKMEKHLYRVYNEAADDISKKWYKYMQSHERTLKDKYNTLQEANKSGDQDAIKKAKEDYERAVKNITLNNDRYNAMLNETTSKISHVNGVALDYVNGNTPKIYTLNYNEFANEKINGYTFTLVNEQAVKELATKDKTLLPKKKLDVPKDKKWNEKQINSQVLQGILQGENITKIAKRLTTVTDMNRSSAIRNARTITTAAENKGRQDSFEKATNDGVLMTREWVATKDERTRAWHTDLDGVNVKVGEPWENEYGQIMYPGDPSADPANVYNCRCAIRARVQGFNFANDKYLKEHKNKTDQLPQNEIINGKDLTNIWKRRSDQFNSEIEDIIDAQGFNGVPLLLKEKEFNKKVVDAKLIAQRTYTAESKDSLQEKQLQLYYGKWDISRKTGKSVYGSGMYIFSTDDYKINNSMIKAVEKYHEGKEFYKVETLTLDKSAKLVDFIKIKQEMIDEGLRGADVGSYAALKGYDGIKVKNAGAAYGKNLDYIIVLNRTKVIIKKGN